MLNKGHGIARLLLLLVLCAASVELSASGKQGAGAAPFISAGKLTHGRVVPQDGQRGQSWRFKVDEGMYAVQFRMQGATADLDLIIYDEEGTEVIAARSTTWNEQLFLSRLSSPALENGTYTVKVAYLEDTANARNGAESVDFDIDYNPIKVKDAVTLRAGQIRSDKLESDSGMMRVYKIQVAAEAGALGIDVFGSQTDTDVFAQAGEIFADPRTAVYASQSYRSRERLVVPFESGDADNKGMVTVWVMVESEVDDVPADFSILCSAGREIPPVLLSLPDFMSVGRASQATAPALERVLEATVEVLNDNGGGSGCVISPKGWIVTNLHVVRGVGGRPEKRVSIGFSLDHSKVPDSQFWADVVAVDERRDLALLHITNGFYGQKIPDSYRFPWIPLNGTHTLRIGDPLYLVGYPTIGGLGSRPTITFTEGLTSGFQNRGFGVLIKTAGMISAGNSGGAALDRDWHLVGLPTVVVGDSSSQIAYIYPIELIPEDWKKQAAIPAGE